MFATFVAALPEEVSRDDLFGCLGVHMVVRIACVHPAARDALGGEPRARAYLNRRTFEKPE
jgi:hypothetical protein